MHKDIEKLWLPEIIYENTDQKESSRLGVEWEWKTTVLVKREQQENFNNTNLNLVDETYIFNGPENSLIMKQTYTHDFQCTYDMKYYPFDTQASYF